VPPHAFFLTPPILAVALLVSACSPEADPGELRDLLVENGSAETHIDISDHEAEGLHRATDALRGDCELPVESDVEEEVLVLGTHTDGYLQEAPEGATLESFDPVELTQTCDGKF